MALERTRVGRVIAWAALAAMAAMTLVVAWPGAAPLRARARDRRDFGWAVIPLVLAGWGLALALWVGLKGGRATVLVGGVTAATAVLLAYGTWLHHARAGDTADIPRLAARLEAHARGGEAGVLFETGWLEVDYYLGRPLREIRTTHRAGGLPGPHRWARPDERVDVERHPRHPSRRGSACSSA